MKRLLALLPFVFFAWSPLHAQVQCGVTATCVTSFSISPSEIQGDGLHIATATASAVLAPGDSELLLEFIRPDSILWWICLPPAT